MVVEAVLAVLLQLLLLMPARHLLLMVRSFICLSKKKINTSFVHSGGQQYCLRVLTHSPLEQVSHTALVHIATIATNSVVCVRALCTAIVSRCVAVSSGDMRAHYALP